MNVEEAAIFYSYELYLGHGVHHLLEKPNPLSNFAVSAVHYKGRIFISLPRKQPGVISTLNYVYADYAIGSSPPLQPYPNLRTNKLTVGSVILMVPIKN